MCFLKSTAKRKAEEEHSAFKKFVQSSQNLFPSVSHIHQEEKSPINQYKNNQETLSSSSSDEFKIFENFQTLINMINFNNSLTMNLMQKNYIMEENMKTLDNLLQEINNEKKIKNQETIQQRIELNQEIPGDALIKKLFGDQVYKYQLVLDNPLSMKFYKERNFDVNIKLVDKEQNIILNSNPIPISFSIYSSSENPEIIAEDKYNQPILKGNTQNQLYRGKSSFIKIHMREVTSYYKNGWVYFVIYPKNPSFAYNNRESSIESVVKFSDIKPLVISDVVVRAKKK